MAPTKTRTLL